MTFIIVVNDVTFYFAGGRDRRDHGLLHLPEQLERDGEHVGPERVGPGGRILAETSSATEPWGKLLFYSSFLKVRKLSSFIFPRIPNFPMHL